MIEEVHYNVQDTQTSLLDFGATFHVTPNIEWFLNHLTGLSATLWLSNGLEYKIDGTGEVLIEFPNGNTITMHQVRHVPVLKRLNLVSIGMLAEDGYRMTLVVMDDQQR